MKIVILIAFGIAGALLLIGSREMDRTDTSPDVSKEGGALLMLAGLGVGAIALVATVITFLLG